METIRAAYRDDDTDNSSANNAVSSDPTPTPTAPDAVATTAATTTTTTTTTTSTATPDTETETLADIKDESIASEDDLNNNDESPKFTKVSEDDFEDDNPDDADDDEDVDRPPKKQKQLSSLTPQTLAEAVDDDVIEVTPKQPTRRIGAVATATETTTAVKKSKKKSKNSNSVWTKPNSRKGKKKTKNNNGNNSNNGTPNPQTEDKVLITPVPRFTDKTDDTPEMEICLSKVYKAEKVELSDDRMSAGSTKGYRMVRATRGVLEGAWYFEIKVVRLGVTGHVRLGWSTEKGDLQAPVGYDSNSFGYRDIDGTKVHKALRENYGEEGYVEGDVIGFYIKLPEGSSYAPKPPHLVWYKGQRYVCAPDAKEDPPKVIPGSEISFFKNGICQGVAFRDLFGGRYYPAASMYTLPNQPNCLVKFNFGPDFECFPEDFGDRQIPRPMIEVPYHGYDYRVENGIPWGSARMCPTLKVVKD